MTAAPLRSLMISRLGPERAEALFRLVVVRPELLLPAAKVSRAVMAQALNLALLDDLLDRVPDARAYAGDCLAEGRTITHDHGAVRSVLLDGMGALPSGDAALTRILFPLGYKLAGLYPLERLKMTGRSYAQADYPEDIGQFFISELHVDRFSPAFQAATRRITASSRDPVTAQAKTVLAVFERDGEAELEDCIVVLETLVSAFGRQHAPPDLDDYEILLAESAEMAWISTEGNAFNHATDRVENVEAVATAQKALGRPMKAQIEVAREGRVRQTAFQAAQVVRPFVQKGRAVERTVPGSFYEFITRLPEPQTGRIDLAFDSANAQGIFKMTEAAGARQRPG